MAKKALIVGINDYAQSPLTGCIADAMDVRSILSGLPGPVQLPNFGFACTTLLNRAAATKTAILAALRALIAGTVSGDSLVFYFSGHGSQVRDVNGDESDGWDEVLCPGDWPAYVSDDDLRAVFNLLPAGVTLDVFLDCCHSGTGTRVISGDGSTCVTRSLPPLVIDMPRKHRGKKTRAYVPVPTLKHSLWAGCKDSQTSSELMINGQVRGAFTYYLTKALRGYWVKPATRSTLMSQVSAGIAGLKLTQIPQLETSATEAAHQPFK